MAIFHFWRRGRGGRVQAVRAPHRSVGLRIRRSFTLLPCERTRHGRHLLSDPAAPQRVTVQLLQDTRRAQSEERLARGRVERKRLQQGERLAHLRAALPGRLQQCQQVAGKRYQSSECLGPQQPTLQFRVQRVQRSVPHFPERVGQLRAERVHSWSRRHPRNLKARAGAREPRSRANEFSFRLGFGAGLLSAGLFLADRYSC
jgi:hypothetical protein